MSESHLSWWIPASRYFMPPIVKCEPREVEAMAKIAIDVIDVIDAATRDE